VEIMVMVYYYYS